MGEWGLGLSSEGATFDDREALCSCTTDHEDVLFFRHV
jgi:hypothetical protein